MEGTVLYLMVAYVAGAFVLGMLLALLLDRAEQGS